jgi:transposase InsO family protein
MTSVHKQGVAVISARRKFGETFYTLAEARLVVESWRRLYNTLRPHGSLGYRLPAPEVFIPQYARAAALPQPASPPALASKPPMH